MENKNSFDLAVGLLYMCLLIVIIIIIGGFIVDVTWNVFMPEVFGLPDIDITKGIALFILANLLFGGFGFYVNIIN